MNCAQRRCRGCSECGNPITRGEAVERMQTRAVFLGLDVDFEEIGEMLDRHNLLGFSWADISTMSDSDVKAMLCVGA